MKNKIILTSVLTIMLCLSLIAGSTFAIFEARSEVNIAVTSGKLDITAVTSDLKAYSRDEARTVATVDGKSVAAFANGGAATLDGGHLDLSLITPGDRVTFLITVDVESTIAMQHNVSWTIAGDLAPYLTTSITRVELQADGSYAPSNNTVTTNGWELWTGTEAETIVYLVEVGMDITVGNEAQNKSASIDFMFQAVQANADVQ